MKTNITYKLDVGKNDDKEKFYFVSRAMDSAVNHDFLRYTVNALQNMADFYKDGRTIDVMHMAWGNLGIGRSESAEVKNKALFVKSFLTRNMELTGLGVGSTEDIIKAIKTGHIRDVSVAMHLDIDHITCDYCNEKVEFEEEWFGMYPNHRHLPGRRYDGNDKRTDDKRFSPVSYSVDKIKDVQELSLVQQGGNPNATITAYNNSQDGVIDTVRSYSVGNYHYSINPDKGDESMADEKLQEQVDTLKTEKAELQKQIDDNKAFVEYGKKVHNEAVNEFVKQWTRYAGRDEVVTVDAQNAKREWAKTRTLDELETDTKHYKETADDYADKDRQTQDKATSNDEGEFDPFLSIPTIGDPKNG